jgi:hypothetical protein
LVKKSQDKKKNTLSADEKLEILKAAHKDQPKIFDSSDNIFYALSNMYEKGYKKVTVVLGDDRVSDFDMIKKYNGKFNKDGKGYKFDEIKLISRHDIHNTRTGGGDGIHASDLRNAAKDDNYSTFAAGMSKNLSPALIKATMKKIKSRLNENTREKFIDGYLYETGDIIIHNEKRTIHEIIDFGPNYVTVVNEAGELSKMWNKNVFLANSLREDFDELRRKRSSNNQVAYVGFKTKHFNKEHYDLFHPLIKENHDKFVIISALRTTDQLLSEEITVDNVVRMKALFEQSGKVLSKICDIEDHTYRDEIEHKLNSIINTQ